MRMKTRSLRSESVTPLEHAKGHILNEIYALAHQSIDDAKQGWVTPFARGEIMTNGEAKKSSSTIEKSTTNYLFSGVLPTPVMNC